MIDKCVFTSPPEHPMTQRLSIDPQLRQMSTDYWVYWKHGEYYYSMLIGRGFIFNGNSTHRLLWTISGITDATTGEAAPAAHDLPYSLGGVFPKPGESVPFDARLYRATAPEASRHRIYELTREQSDDMYYILLLRSGITRWRAGPAWSALRVGGWYHWGTDYGRLG